MREGLNVLRMLFYANLLGGERDTLEILQTERDNDQKMEVELVDRRQEHNEEPDQDEPEQQQQQSERQNENISESAGGAAVAVTSPRPNRSTSFSMRTATTEQDEIESMYENPLQIRLNLEPNEYRHGYLLFEDFINEFANEKIEINKEYLEFIRQRSLNHHFSFILYPFFLSTINKIGKFIE